MKAIDKIKKHNWAETRRKAKTLALVIIFTAAAAFYAGMKYQTRINDHTNTKVSEAVKAVSVNTESAKESKQ